MLGAIKLKLIEYTFSSNALNYWTYKSNLITGIKLFKL